MWSKKGETRCQAGEMVCSSPVKPETMVECISGSTAGHSEDWPALLLASGNLSERCCIWKRDEKQCLRFHMRWYVPPSDNLWTFFCTAIADVDQNLMDRLQRVNNTLFSQISRLQNIRNTIEETGNLAEQARSRVESTEQLIEIASRELEKAKVAIANVVSDWNSLRGTGGVPWSLTASLLLVGECFLR